MLRSIERCRTVSENHITIAIIWESAIAILHIIGMLTLLVTLRRGYKNVQYLFLINLSAARLLKSAGFLAESAISLQLNAYGSKLRSVKNMDELVIVMTRNYHRIHHLTDARCFTALINWTVVCWVHTLALMLATAERLIKTVTAKHVTLCTDDINKVLLCLFWIVFFVIPLIATALYKIGKGRCNLLSSSL